MGERKLRAKFSCDSVKGEGYGELVNLTAVYGKDEKDNEENNQFSEATPSGSHEMVVSNPDAKGFFEVGKDYYLEFTLASR